MTGRENKSRYRTVAGEHWIEVRVKDSQRLFDHRDPAPFRERELDAHFVEYIYTSVREFPVSAPIKVIIYIEEMEPSDLKGEAIREAIQSYFSYQIELQAGRLKRFWKRAQLFLFIGIAILILCIGFAQSIPILSKPGAWGILREGIVIFGWVSIWKPIEVILFDWYPLFEDLRYYKKLRSTEMDIRFLPTGQE